MATFETLSVKIGDVDLDNDTALIIGTCLLSSNPAASSAEFAGRDKLANSEFFLANLPALVDAFQNETLTLEVTSEDDKRGTVTKTRSCKVSDLTSVVEGIVTACKAMSTLEKMTTYKQEVENPSEGKRGRKSASKGFTFNIPLPAAK